MSSKTKFIAATLAALTLAGSMTLTTTNAQAGGKGAAIGLGIAAGVIAGAAIASSTYPTYYEPGYVEYRRPRHCHWRRQYDSYGYYIGKVRVCGHY